jgi:hypothetical protein
MLFVAGARSQRCRSDLPAPTHPKRIGNLRQPRQPLAAQENRRGSVRALGPRYRSRFARRRKSCRDEHHGRVRRSPRPGQRALARPRLLRRSSHPSHVVDTELTMIRPDGLFTKVRSAFVDHVRGYDRAIRGRPDPRAASPSFRGCGVRLGSASIKGQGRPQCQAIFRMRGRRRDQRRPAGKCRALPPRTAGRRAPSCPVMVTSRKRVPAISAISQTNLSEPVDV